MSPSQQPKKMIVLCCIIVTILGTHLIHADEIADYYKASDSNNLLQLNERENEDDGTGRQLSLQAAQHPAGKFKARFRFQLIQLLLPLKFHYRFEKLVTTLLNKVLSEQYKLILVPSMLLV